MSQGPGGLLLARKCCSQCLFTPRRIVSGEERKAEIIATCLRRDQHFQCHKGTLAGLDVACRGFYEHHPGIGQLVRIAARLRAITEVDADELPPAGARNMEEKRGRKARIDRAEAKRLEDEEHLSREQIAQRLGCRPSYLSAVLGPKKGREAAPQGPSEKKGEIKALLEKQTRKSAIQAQLHCSYGLIQACALELEATGWRYAPQSFGEERESALAGRNAQIIAEHKEGATVEALARQHELKERTIRHILQEHTDGK